MKTIKLPETDYAGMRRFYQEELDKTLKRLQHIQSVLAQLGDTSVVIDKAILNVTAPDANTFIGETEKNVSAKPKRKYRKKAGRKALWGPIILKRMKQLNRPLTYDELTDEIMTFSNLAPQKREATKQAIINVTFRLRTKEKKVNTFSNGSRIKYLALNQWFDENGEISEVYRRMLPQPTSAAKRRMDAKKTAAEIAKDPSKASEIEKPKRGRPRKPISSVWADPSKRPVKGKAKPSTAKTSNADKPKRGRPRKDASASAMAATVAKAAPAAKAIAKEAKASKAKPVAKAKLVAKAKPATKTTKAKAAAPKAKAKTSKAASSAPTKPISKLNTSKKPTATKAVSKKAKPAAKKTTKPKATAKTTKPASKPAAKRGRPAKKK